MHDTEVNSHPPAIPTTIDIAGDPRLALRWGVQADGELVLAAAAHFRAAEIAMQKRQSTGRRGQDVRLLDFGQVGEPTMPQKYATMVQIHLERNEFAAAHAAIDRAYAEHLASDPRRRNPNDVSLAETGLDARTINRMEKAGIFTLGQLADASDERILSIPNVGQTTLRRIHLTLESWGCYTPPE